MSQVLVLRTDDEGGLTLKELDDFVKAAKGRETVKMSQEIQVSASEDGGEVVMRLIIPLKPSQIRHEKKPELTEHQKEVREYIAKNKGSGRYVPPMGKKGPPKRRKVKCPVCNVRKPIATVAGVKTVKPHISHGEPCEGGGTQVMK